MTKIENDQNDFMKQLNILDTSDNILNQLPSYNVNDTNYFINNLEEEYEQQKTLHTILTNKNFNNEIVNITKFIDENSSIINKQYSKLLNVSSNLQKIVNTNKEIQNEKTELEELLNSKTYIDLANKLKLIKKEKEKIKLFLKKNDIISLI
jgi:ATP phosphoribosyltransferase regulatory subunit HisZ